MSRYSNNPLESVCSAMCFKIVQLRASEWLRSMSAVRGKNAAHSHWFYVQAKGGCHATDAVATYRPDWQARLQTDVRAAPWSSILRDTATAMKTRKIHSPRVTVPSQASVRIFCLHICIQVPKFIEEKHLVYEQGIFKSVGLPAVTEQSVPCHSNPYLYLSYTLF